MLWLIPAGLAAAGAYKGQQDLEQSNRDRMAQAEVARWSPWTGMAPQQVSRGAGVLGGALQGGVAGAGLMQGFSAAEAPTTGGEAMAGEAAPLPPNQAYGYQRPINTWQNMPVSGRSIYG
jgi:hypothetical protein